MRLLRLLRLPVLMFLLDNTNDVAAWLYRLDHHYKQLQRQQLLSLCQSSYPSSYRQLLALSSLPTSTVSLSSSVPVFSKHRSLSRTASTLEGTRNPNDFTHNNDSSSDNDIIINDGGRTEEDEEGEEEQFFELNRPTIQSSSRARFEEEVLLLLDQNSSNNNNNDSKDADEEPSPSLSLSATTITATQDNSDNLNNDDIDTRSSSSSSSPLSSKDTTTTTSSKSIATNMNYNSSSNNNRIMDDLRPPPVNFARNSILFSDNPSTKARNNPILDGWIVCRTYLPPPITGAWVWKNVQHLDDRPLGALYNVVFVRVPVLCVTGVYLQNLLNHQPLVMDIIGTGPTEMNPIIVLSILIVILL
jgi:hypothetical protein